MNICVFCGSNTGLNPVFSQSTQQLGALMASHSIRLVYGGGNVGLMGVIADAVMENGGEVLGVIPDFLVKREVGHKGITKLEIVNSMHERKQRMAELSDGFIALPGGWGTLDELNEILTWRQLKLITHPVVLLNIEGFFDPLLQQMSMMASEGFLRKDFLDTLQVASTPSQAISLVSYKKG